MPKASVCILAMMEKKRGAKNGLGWACLRFGHYPSQELKEGIDHYVLSSVMAVHDLLMRI